MPLTHSDTMAGCARAKPGSAPRGAENGARRLASLSGAATSTRRDSLKPATFVSKNGQSA